MVPSRVGLARSSLFGKNNWEPPFSTTATRVCKGRLLTLGGFESLSAGKAVALSLMGLDDEGPVVADHGDEAASKRSPATTPPEDVESDKTVQKLAQASEEIGPKAASESLSPKVPSSPVADDERRPPLPPRPTDLSFLQGKHDQANGLQVPKRSTRPQLQSTATTAISRTDIHTQSYQDGSRETMASDAQTTPPSKYLGGFSSVRRFKKFGSSEDDSASVESYAPTLEAGGDVESLLGEVLGSSQESPAWKMLSTKSEAQDPFDSILYNDDGLSADFYREFDAIGEVDPDGGNEGRNAMSSSKPIICADAVT